MAEKIKYKQREYIIHHIICDKCNKHICDSEEHDDGYYHDPSEYEQSWYLGGSWYKYTAQLCEECAAKTTNSLIEMLIGHGFRKL